MSDCQSGLYRAEFIEEWTWSVTGAGAGAPFAWAIKTRTRTADMASLDTLMAHVDVEAFPFVKCISLYEVEGGNKNPISFLTRINFNYGMDDDGPIGGG